MRLKKTESYNCTHSSWCYKYLKNKKLSTLLKYYLQKNQKTKQYYRKYFYTLQDRFNLIKEWQIIKRIHPDNEMVDKISEKVNDRYNSKYLKNYWSICNFYHKKLGNMLPIYICDTETVSTDTTLITHNLKEPYLWAFIKMKLDNNPENNYQLVNYEEFKNIIKNITYSQKWLFHNATFDYKYIFGYLINEMGFKILQTNEHNPDKRKAPPKTMWAFLNEKKKFFKGWIKLENHKIIHLECSYLKIPLSVAKIGKELNKKYHDLKMVKQELDYDLFRTKNHHFTENDTKYIVADVQIVKTMMNDITAELKKHFPTFNWRLTIASTALNLLKTVFFKKTWDGYFKNKLSFEDEKYLRPAYNGGCTFFSIHHLFIELKNVTQQDIVSSYPHIMRNFELPYGKKVMCYQKNCQHFKFYELKNINVQLRKNQLPVLPVKTIYGNLYVPPHKKSYFAKREIMSEIRLKLWAKIYEGKYEIIKTMCFEKKIIPEFKDYVDKLLELKSLGKLTDNIILKLGSKILLNSVYGKFGQNIYDSITGLNSDLEEVTTDTEPNVENIAYLPMAIAITDFARNRLYDMMLVVGVENVVYGDTDSVMSLQLNPDDLKYDGLSGNENNFRAYTKNKELGKWEIDHYQKMLVIGAKKYWYLKNNKYEYKVAGLSDVGKAMLTPETFRPHLKIEGYGLKQTRLKGYPIFHKTDYTIQNVTRGYLFYYLDYWKEIPKDYQEHVIRLIPIYFSNKKKVKGKDIEIPSNKHQKYIKKLIRKNKINELKKYLLSLKINYQLLEDNSHQTADRPTEVWTI